MVWRWSKIAANNANSDATINWAEGQPPSSINDSARAEMARVAQYRDDIAGAIVTAGTSTAYTVSSNQVFDTLAHMDGAMVAFTPHATNGATVTLNVDSLGAKPLRTAPAVELTAGMIIQGTPYTATYNNTDGAWYLKGFYSLPYSVPIGGLMPFIIASVPNSNFVQPYGQALSRTTYSTLFSLVGTTYGSGDGSTTFNIPDLRGRVPVGADAMGGVAAGRVTSAGSGVDGMTLGATGGAQNHTLTVTEMPAHYHGVYLTDPGHAHTVNPGPANLPSGSGGTNSYMQGAAVATSTATTGITISSPNGANTTYSMGSGGAHSIMPPSIILSYILRVI